MVVEVHEFKNIAKSVSIEVRDGKAISITKLEASDTGIAELYKPYETIGKIFDVIEKESRSNNEVLAVSYDPLLGYPRTVDVDLSKKVADDQLTIRVLSLISQ